MKNYKSLVLILLAFLGLSCAGTRETVIQTQPTKNLGHIKRLAVVGFQPAESEDMKDFMEDNPQAIDDLIEYLTTKIYALGTIDLVDMRAAMRSEPTRPHRPAMFQPDKEREISPEQRRLIRKLKDMPPWKRKEILKNISPQERNHLRKLRKFLVKDGSGQEMMMDSLDPKILANMGRQEGTDAILTGRINVFNYDEDNVEKSYLEMTIKLIDTRDGMILWTTPMKGQLEALTDAFANTLNRHQMMEKRR